MNMLNVAIIGQGRSGRDIHGAFFKSELNTKYRVVAVVDALPERRERAKQEWGEGVDVYESYTELYGRTDIDVVVNSTFSHMHAAVTEDLLLHGFNVVCEKPFARTYEEGAHAVKVAEKSGKMLNIFQQSRFAPYYVKIREIIDSGILGDPVQIAISFSGYARRWDWQTSLAYGGGNLRNTGPHPLDQALDWLDFDENIRVLSRMTTVNTAGDAEDYAKILMDCPGKPLIDVEISSCDAYLPYTYRISCTKGCLRSTHKVIEMKYFDPEAQPIPAQVLAPLCKEDGTPAYCSETLDWKEETIQLEGTAFTYAVRSYYDMIYDYLVDGKPMKITPYQVLRQLRLIDEIRAQNPLPLKD